MFPICPNTPLREVLRSQIASSGYDVAGRGVLFLIDINRVLLQSMRCLIFKFKIFLSGELEDISV